MVRAIGSLAVLVCGAAWADCPPGTAFFETALPVPATAQLVEADRFPTYADWRGCRTDESSTDCAFAEDDAARLRALHRAFEERRGPGRVVPQDGGVCVPASLREPAVRWAAGTLPLRHFIPWGNAFRPLGWRPRELGTPALTQVEVVLQTDGGPAPADVAALLLPHGPLLRLSRGRFSGEVLGPVTDVAAVGGSPARLLPWAFTPVDGGLRVELDASPPPRVLVRVKGGSPASVTVHGWTDKAWAYDGEPATTRQVPVRGGVAVLTGLKPAVESSPRPYVVEARTGARWGAVVVSAASGVVDLPLEAPAIIDLTVSSARGPVRLLSTAFYDVRTESFDPADVDAAGGPCAYDRNAYWGERAVTGTTNHVVVRAPRGKGRCLLVRAQVEDVAEELWLEVPRSVQPTRVTRHLDER